MRKRYRALFTDPYNEPYFHRDFWTASGMMRFVNHRHGGFEHVEFLKYSRDRRCYVKIAYSTGVGW